MIRRLLLSCLAVSLLVACGGGGSAESTAACDAPRAQPIDPGSSQHMLPGAPAPTYNTNPPTSGAHAPGNHPRGVQSDAIAAPVQVALLEGGAVLLQYRDISAPQRRVLERVASSNELVVVAPNDSLPSPIVATAWLYMLRCDEADKTALEEFVADHAGKGPGH